MLKKIILFFVACFLLFFTFHFIVRADDELNQIENQLRDLNTQRASKQANQEDLIKKLENIKAELVTVEEQINQKASEVKKGEEGLAYQKKLLNERIYSYYKNIGKNTLSLIDILVAENLSRSLENFFYQKSLVDEDKNTIVKIVFYIKDLEEKKASLEQNQKQLVVLKIEADKQSQALAGEITTISQKIAELSARQQQLIAQKLASLNIPRSAATGLAGCTDDRGVDPGFSPRLAFFTYGVPNRVGLNQYGARGRADSGQGYEDILKAYYNFDSMSDADTGIRIRVDGHSDYALEDYVKRIYEVPSDWNMEALKAQAVAARSYVLAYTNNGSGSICDSQSCQVFQDNEKGGRWNEAVDQTKGRVMTQGGKPIKAWFSSTHGGYVLSSGEIGWSGTSWTKHATDASGGVNSFSDLQNNAYDKSSPWFYCDWGSRAEFSKTAWLKASEVADIVNAIQLAKRDSSIQEHLYQSDRPNPAGTDTWDAEKVKSELRTRGGNPYNSVSDVSVGVDFGAGRVNTVSVSGDAGNTSFDGGEFKNFFNLRAPANVQIVGPLFAVEKR